MILYSELTRQVENNEILISPNDGMHGMFGLYSNKLADSAYVGFDGEYKPMKPTFVLKWDLFNMSLSFPIIGVLTAGHIKVNTTMFKSMSVVKDCVPGGVLYIKDVDFAESSCNRFIKAEDIDFSELFATHSFDDYMKYTVRMLELGAESKVINYYLKSKTPLVIDGLSVEEIDYLKSLGLSANSFNPAHDYKQHVEPKIKISIKSFSTIPSIPTVLSKIETNKNLTPSDNLVAKYVEKYSLLMLDDLQTSAKLVEDELDALKELTRATNYSILYKGYRFDDPMFIEKINGMCEGYDITFGIK